MRKQNLPQRFKKRCSLKDDAKEYAALDEEGRKVGGGGST